MAHEFNFSREFNFDGLVGPTHNYAGLSFGNLASAGNALMVSNPREGALQGIAKMRRLMNLGMKQGFLPPHERPHIPTLKRLGFSGSDAEIVAKAAKDAPGLLRNCSAASAMWTANAATVSPSSDTADGRVHFTPANLTAMFHRAIEPVVTGRCLAAIFADEDHFAHHRHLPGGNQFGDEGAANHNRFCHDYGDQGVELFIYGQQFFGGDQAPKKFPARHTREASEAVARLHGLNMNRTAFVQQNPAAIDAGAFHNDVVAVSNRNVFFYHELAFADPQALQAQLRTLAPEIDFQFVEVAADDLSLGDAVKSYLFNSQLVSIPGRDGMSLILPLEVEETPAAKAVVDGLVSGNSPIEEAIYMDVRQSMRNGGGPACLRLRVVLDDAQEQAIKANSIVDEALLQRLEAWVRTHYRDRLSPEDMADPALLMECRTALDELTQIMAIGAVYDFQR